MIVHDQQPELFLIDIKDLLNTGSLKRTFGGIEYTAPLSATWGSGDLKKPFVMASEIAHSTLPIWESPGLVIAFTKAGIVDENAPLSKRIEQTRQLIITVLQAQEHPQPFFITSAEELLRKALQHKLQLTEQDLQDYENRPRPMIQRDLLMQASGKREARRGKEAHCRTFDLEFEAASKAFRSLTENALLRAWEFTLASFAEVKANFARYNFYSSLGLGSQEQGGLGECLYNALKKKLDEANRETQEQNELYEQMFMQVKHFEGRLSRASTEKEMAWLRMEYRNRLSDLHHYEELRNMSHYRARRFAELFNILIDIYDKKFIEYFQEVYDADIHEVTVGPYDDSPAGFRLLYKAGRAHVSQWERIMNHNQFIDALVGFFVSTEREIVTMPELEDLADDISQIITALVSHVKTREFLETAFYRMAIAHQAPLVKNPLDNLGKVQKKPWVYTSGGTMGSLVSAYFGREEKPQEVERWVENETELLVFLLDTLKQLPSDITDKFLKDPAKSMLMHSPTHAFLLKPGQSAFKEGWLSDTYTYTWIRDEVVVVAERFVDGLYLDDTMIHYLLELVIEKLPNHTRSLFKEACSRPPRRMRCYEFRRYVTDILTRQRSLRYGGHVVIDGDTIDSMLYSLLPLIPENSFRTNVGLVLQELPQIDGSSVAKLLELLDVLCDSLGRRAVYSARDLREICQILLIFHYGMPSTSTPFLALIANITQRLGFAMPKPMIFADTNWVKDYFGFVVNPGTRKFELWRLDPLGTEGAPMSLWKQWLDGSRKDRKWGVYTHPHEYRGKTKP